jgi:hypothetical protein
VFRDGGDSFIDFDQANGIGTENVEADVDSIVETANGDATTTGGDVAAQNFREGIQLNPIKLYLSDISEHIDETAWNSVDPNPTDDEEGRLKRFDNFNGRVQEVDPKLLKNLSLDDVFRADNRWGPRSSYTAEGEVKIDVPGDIGVSISGNATLTNSQSGLDGYWERQATSQGTRFIVGERLELGNAHGWNYDPTGSVTPKKDSLYPPDLLPTNTETNNGGRRQFGVAEQKQRRTSARQPSRRARHGGLPMGPRLRDCAPSLHCRHGPPRHRPSQLPTAAPFRKTGIAMTTSES